MTNINFQNNNQFIVPEWQVGENIKAATSTKLGGISSEQYSSCNISNKVGDLEHNVSTNRELLQQKLKLSSSPLWLNQVHGNRVILHSEYSDNIKADAIICDQKNIVCAIQTADCLPILLCHENGKIVAAIHAGWKGLYQEIIKHTLLRMNCDRDGLQAWIGPAISKESYMVNVDLYDNFCNLNTVYAKFFEQDPSGTIHADLKAIAKFQLENLQIKKITISKYCTYSDHKYFYSYRRNNVTGRQANLIWLI